MMDGSRNLYFDSPNLCLLRLFICLSALAREWGRGGLCELSCAREKLAWCLGGRLGCWLWLNCFAFQRMSAERGNEGCGMMMGLEQDGGTSSVGRADPLPQVGAVLYWLALPCRSYCSPRLSGNPSRAICGTLFPPVAPREPADEPSCLDALGLIENSLSIQTPRRNM